MLTSAAIIEVANVHVVEPADVPNHNWLISGIPSLGQQEFGGKLLTDHKFVVIPSVVSIHNWNLLFIPANAAGAYQIHDEEPFALDTRLHPGARSS